MKMNFCTFGQRNYRKGRRGKMEDNRRGGNVKCKKAAGRKRFLRGSFPSESRAGAVVVSSLEVFQRAIAGKVQQLEWGGLFTFCPSEMPFRGSANPISILHMQLNQVRFPVSNCLTPLKFGFLKTCISSDSLLSNGRRLQGVCAEVHEHSHRGASWDPLRQWCDPYLRQNTEAWKGWNTSVLATKWNGERRKDGSRNQNTHTHTPACNSAFFPGSFVQQLCREVTWISYNE